MKTIAEVVREAEQNYLNGSTNISEYVDFDMHDTIETIDAYLNSTHISGSIDSLGREKPFFNIVIAASNIWYRATDIDRKDIRIIPPHIRDTGTAFIATVLLQDWMREARFGMFLNDWGRTLARYGSAVVKFVEQDGVLVAKVVPWNRIIADPIDFDALPTIEKFYLTPEQLRENDLYDQDVVSALIDAQSSRETLDGHEKDTADHFIELYEVHGRMADSMLTDDFDMHESDENYVQQMHVVSFVQNGEDYEDFTLYRGREAKDPYMITHLIPEDGRTLAIGAVEHLFESQWMVNHNVKNIKDTLDLSSKLILQTSDPSFVGRNVLTAIETGQIMVHKINEPLTRLANDKPDITASQNFAQQWQGLANEITSTPDAIKGNTLPSGTPYSLGAFLGAQANSLFEQMTENKGLHLEDMMREHILPHIKKRMDSKEEVVAILDEHEIQEIDAMYVPREAVRRHREESKKMLLKAPTDIEGVESAEIPSPFQADVEEQRVRDDLATLGNKRSFKPDELDEKTWKEALDGFEMRVKVEVTNENTDKQAVLTTLASLYQTTAQTNPEMANMILGRILTETGVFSPLQVGKTSAQTPPATGGDGNLQEIANLNNGR